MVKLKDFSDKHLKTAIEALLSRGVSKEWLRDFLLQKEFKVSHHSRDLSLAEFFEIFIWDNLTDEQQNKVVEALNLVIEEDLFLPTQPNYGYWSDLLDFAIFINQRFPQKINSKPFIIWKDKNYPNLINSSEQVHLDFIKKLDQKIESAFGKGL